MQSAITCPHFSAQLPALVWLFSMMSALAMDDPLSLVRFLDQRGAGKRAWVESIR
jgi:hypothetical protein